MRTQIVCACAVVLFLAGLASNGRADDTATRKALEKQYAKISQAYKTKSLKSLQDVTTPDFTLTLPGGKNITRQQMESQFTTSLSFLQSVSNATEKISTLKVKGNEATVDTNETISGVMMDMQAQAKTHVMGLVNQNRDTWVKSGGTWMRKHSTVVKGTVTMDGKSMDLGAQLKKMNTPTGAPGSKPMNK